MTLDLTVGVLVFNINAIGRGSQHWSQSWSQGRQACSGDETWKGASVLLSILPMNMAPQYCAYDETALKLFVSEGTTHQFADVTPSAHVFPRPTERTGECLQRWIIVEHDDVPGIDVGHRGQVEKVGHGHWVRVSSVDIDELTAVGGVRQNELRYRLRRVAEVDEDATGKLARHERRHLVGVLVNTEVEGMDHYISVGRQMAERAVSEVEARLTDPANVRPAGQVMKHLELRRLLERESFELFVDCRPVDGGLEVWEVGVVLGRQLERGDGRAGTEQFVTVGEAAGCCRNEVERRGGSALKQLDLLYLLYVVSGQNQNYKQH